MKAKMVKSPWPVEIPNGTIGDVLGYAEGHPVQNWYEVKWSTGHVLRMHDYEIEVRTNG